MVKENCSVAAAPFSGIEGDGGGIRRFLLFICAVDTKQDSFVEGQVSRGLGQSIYHDFINSNG